MKIRDLGFSSWLSVSHAMYMFSKHRKNFFDDECWIVEHNSVYTYGPSVKYINSKKIYNIPIYPTDRGGKITYHGPGQIIIYFLIDLKNNIKLSFFLEKIKKFIKFFLLQYNIYANFSKNFPGFFVENKKICSLGFRVIHGCLYHGISINVMMDLIPYLYIKPCGSSKIKMIDMFYFNKKISVKKVKKNLMYHLKLFFLKKNIKKINT